MGTGGTPTLWTPGKWKDVGGARREEHLHRSQSSIRNLVCLDSEVCVVCVLGIRVSGWFMCLEPLFQEHALLTAGPCLHCFELLCIYCFLASLCCILPPSALRLKGLEGISSSPRSIGTATLNTLLCVHLPPITRSSTGDLTRLTLWEFSSWGALRA